MCFEKNYIKNIANMVVTIRPIATGFKFLLASSNGSTLQIAATGIRAQGIIVPPPTHIADICPKAVRVAVPLWSAVPNIFATEPASDIPENPEPSRPVIIPTVVRVVAPIGALIGTVLARARPKSFTRPVEPLGSTSPNTFIKPKSPR